MSLCTEREKLPDAHHPNDSVSESISPYELVACGPISHPNIWAALLVQNVHAPLLLPSLTFLRTFLYPRSCTRGTRAVHEGEPPWRWRENSHQARVRLCPARRNKKRPSRKQVTAEHRVASITSSYYKLFSISVIGAPNYTSICLERKIGDERTTEGTFETTCSGRSVCQRRIRVTEKAALRRFVRRFVGCLVVLVMKNFVVKRRCASASRKGK